MTNGPKQSEASRTKSAAVYTWLAGVGAMLIIFLAVGLLLQIVNVEKPAKPEVGVVGGLGNEAAVGGDGMDGNGQSSGGGGGNGSAGVAGKADGTVDEQDPQVAAEESVGIDVAVDTTDRGLSKVKLDDKDTPQIGLIDEDIEKVTPPPTALLGKKTAVRAGGKNAALQGQPGPKNIFQDKQSHQAKRIVYVIDSSGSMDFDSGKRLALAKSELVKSLEGLTKQQFFYVVFFSDKPKKMPSHQMLRGLPANKKKIENWLPKIPAVGGTKVAQAMEIAISKKPDLIWLLTDGIIDDPAKAQKFLDEYRRKYPGRKFRINTIAFMERKGERLLRYLARKYGGTYKFVAK